VNAAIPLDSSGRPKFPKNSTINGYVNQHFITNQAKADNLGVCERLQAAGSPHVGEANVFVSWFLGTPIATLLDALNQFVAQHGLDPTRTFFWVCDYVIRQTDVAADLVHLGKCVAAIGHTVLLLEPWDAPVPLKRSYCLKEVVHTQASRAKFELVMSTTQQAAFEAVLGGMADYGEVHREDFDSIVAAISAVNVRTAECRNAKEQAAILSELEAGVGASECNAVVVGLMRDQLVKQARTALDRDLEDIQRHAVVAAKAGHACRGGAAVARGGRGPPQAAWRAARRHVTGSRQLGTAAAGHGPAD